MRLLKMLIIWITFWGLFFFNSFLYVSSFTSFQIYKENFDILNLSLLYIVLITSYLFVSITLIKKLKSKGVATKVRSDVKYAKELGIILFLSFPITVPLIYELSRSVLSFIVQNSPLYITLVVLSTISLITSMIFIGSFIAYKKISKEKFEIESIFIAILEENDVEDIMVEYNNESVNEESNKVTIKSKLAWDNFLDKINIIKFEIINEAKRTSNPPSLKY